MATMSPAELLSAWEDAYLDQCQTARVGRIFKGTIHNLNGVVQAFSMQSELFTMMFSKADMLLGEALENVENSKSRDKIIQTLELLHKREKTLRQVEEKILFSQEILRHNVDISQASVEGSSVTLQSLIHNVVSFFLSHMFFKHKVQQNISVEAEIPLGEKAFSLSVVFANLIENSIQAMEQNSDQEACFSLRCFVRDGQILIEVEDNGKGVPEQIQETLFEQFVSTVPGHHGLGLYQVRKLLAEMGGDIKISRLAKPTLFTASLPTNLEKA